MILGGFRISILEAFLDEQMWFFFMLVPRSLFVMIFQSESGCLGIVKQGFGVRSVAKTTFSHTDCPERIGPHIGRTFGHIGKLKR